MKYGFFCLLAAFLAQGCASSQVQTSTNPKAEGTSRKPAATEHDRPIDCTRAFPVPGLPQKNGTFTFTVDMAGHPKMTYYEGRRNPLTAVVTPCEYAETSGEYSMVLNCSSGEAPEPQLFWYFKNGNTVASQAGHNFNCVIRAGL